MAFKSEQVQEGSAVLVKRERFGKGKVIIWYSIIPGMLQWIRSGEGTEFDDPLLKVTVGKDEMTFDDHAGGVLTVSTTEFPQFLEQLGSEAVSMFENIGRELERERTPEEGERLIEQVEEMPQLSGGDTLAPLQLVKPVAARVYRSVFVDCPMCHLRLELASGDSPNLRGYIAQCSNPACGKWLVLSE